MKFNHFGINLTIPSPSTRREWIEISELTQFTADPTVSLHSEGVD